MIRIEHRTWRNGTLSLLAALTLSACGGGGGGGSMAPDLAANGLPYFDDDAAAEAGGETLLPGETAIVPIVGLHRPTDTVIDRTAYVERIDEDRIRVGFNNSTMDFLRHPADATRFVSETDASLEVRLLHHVDGRYSVYGYNTSVFDANFVIGRLTDLEALPVAGTAYYEGLAYMETVNELGGDISEEWVIALNADFATQQVDGLMGTASTMLGFAPTSYASGTFSATLNGTGGATGEIDGQFIGGFEGGIAGTIRADIDGRPAAGAYVAQYQ